MQRKSFLNRNTTQWLHFLPKFPFQVARIPTTLQFYCLSSQLAHEGGNSDADKMKLFTEFALKLECGEIHTIAIITPRSRRIKQNKSICKRTSTQQNAAKHDHCSCCPYLAEHINWEILKKLMLKYLWWLQICIASRERPIMLDRRTNCMPFPFNDFGLV